MHDLCSFIVVLTVNMNVHFFFISFIYSFSTAIFLPGRWVKFLYFAWRNF